MELCQVQLYKWVLVLRFSFSGFGGLYTSWEYGYALWGGGLVLVYFGVFGCYFWVYDYLEGWF